MSVIKITVNDQNLLITDAPKIAAQGVNENYIKFTFSEDWDGFGKTANFYRDTAPTVIYQSVVDQNGYAAIPHEITANESWICIGLSGVKDDVVKTSEILKYKIVNGLYVVESTDPTPDVYEQILALAGNIEDLVTQIGTDTAASVAAIEASTASSIANIQETVDGIDAAVDQVDARMDTFIASQTGTSNGTLITETSLFTASSPAKTDITVSDDINNYDYIDIRYAVFGRTKISRFLPSDIAAGAHWNEFEHVNTIDIDTGATDPNARSVLRKVGFKLTRASETSLSFELEVWRWDGKSTTNGVNAEAIGSSWNVGIYSITGVKYEAAGTSKDAELTDIRVGADGVTYATAGEAVRTQFTNADNEVQSLKEDLNVVSDGLDDETARAQAEEARIEALFTGDVSEAVSDWLDEHPEATTTVQDGSITMQKIALGTLDYVTPEMFGAVGDGETDDTEALQDAIDYCMAHGKELCFEPKTYAVSVTTERFDNTAITTAHLIYALRIKEGSISINMNGATIALLDNEIECYHVLLIILADGVTITNGTFKGDMDTFTVRTGSWDSSKMIYLFDSKNVTLDHVTITKSKGDGLGFSGVQNGQSANYPFVNYYMNTAIKNCVITEVYRNGITISRARGVIFDGCLVEKCIGTSPQLGVDIEPWYGKGNVFDTTFINCNFRDNFAGDIYAQSSHDIRIINCEGTGSAGAGNAEFVGIYSSKFETFNFISSSGVLKDSTALVNQPTSGGTAVGIVSSTLDWGGSPSVIIDGCNLNGRILTRNTGVVGELLEIVNSVIKTASSTLFAISNTQNMFKNIIIKNNDLYFGTSGSSGNSGSIVVLHGENVTIEGNILNVFATGLSGMVFGTFTEVKSLSVKDNTIRYTQESDVTYSHTPTGIIKIDAGHAIVSGNVLNSDGVLPSKRTTFYAFQSSANADDVSIVFTDNFLNGVSDVVEQSNLKLVANARNDILLPPKSITEGYKLSNKVAVEEETAEIAVYAVTAGEALNLFINADFGDCTCQWQNSDTVPTSSNTHVIGDPITGTVSGIVTVPTGATYLAVSRKTGGVLTKIEKSAMSLWEGGSY